MAKAKQASAQAQPRPAEKGERYTPEFLEMIGEAERLIGGESLNNIWMMMEIADGAADFGCSKATHGFLIGWAAAMREAKKNAR